MSPISVCYFLLCVNVWFGFWIGEFVMAELYPQTSVKKQHIKSATSQSSQKTENNSTGKLQVIKTSNQWFELKWDNLNAETKEIWKTRQHGTLRNPTIKPLNDKVNKISNT
jgi:hypothetical protein